MDLTIVPLPIPHQEIYRRGDKLRSCLLPFGVRFRDNSINMGTGFDCFDPKANTFHNNLTEIEKKNRKILYDVMTQNNFNNYEKEWWHYTLKNEPFPDTYFNFPVN
jgi:D-alanyl-D-alanine dipeptidase